MAITSGLSWPAFGRRATMQQMQAQRLGSRGGAPDGGRVQRGRGQAASGPPPDSPGSVHGRRTLSRLRRSAKRDKHRAKQAERGGRAPWPE